MRHNPNPCLSSADIASERRAISDLEHAVAGYKLALQDIQARMATEGNREVVQEMLDDLKDDAPNIVRMNSRLSEAREE